MEKNAWSRLAGALQRFLKIAATPFVNIFQLLFGQITWSPPDWVNDVRVRTQPLASWVANHALLLGFILVLAAAFWLAKPSYYRPIHGVVPDRIEAKYLEVSVQNPTRTEIEKENAEEKLPKPLVLVFEDTAAPLAHVGKEAPGVTLFPAHPGKWIWASERELKFIPKEDWPVGTEYEIRLGEKALSPHVDIKQRVYKAYSPNFEVAISDAQFYQDPVQANLRQAVFEVSFSHPVEAAEFEKRVQLIYGDASRSLLDFDKPNLKFNVIYDKHKTKATIQSSPLGIPESNATVIMRVAEGLVAQRGGKPMGKVVERALSVPGINGLAIEQIETTVVTGEDGEPQRVLHIKSSMPVHEREIARMLAAWKLPPRGLAKKTGEAAPEWEDPSEVSPEVLKRAVRAPLTLIPQEREASELHAFRFQADAGSSLLIRIQPGLKAVGGYKLPEASNAIMKAKPFAPVLAIASRGSLLTLSGEKKLPISIRDLPGVHIELGRLLPHQLHLLVTQNNGAFTSPQFHQGVTPDHLSERFEKQIPLSLAPGKTRYETVNFAEYLKAGGTERRGAFLLSVRGYDPKKPQTLNSPWPAQPHYPEERYYESEGEEVAVEAPDPSSITDQRLVLVTDLGFIVKKALDGTQDVFVQSIASGTPVADAEVEVWGKNGLVLLTQKTDAKGRAHLVNLAAYVREKEPVLIVVKKSGDLSFMPLVQSDRGLDLSRYDVGGARSTGIPNQMRGYLFSDRGIYRPGDTMRIGIVVKSGDWAQDLKDLPLEAEIIDARGLVAKREKLTLGAAGLTEIAYTTFDSSPTGNYTIHLNLARDSGTAIQEGREAPPLRLGSVSVKVQEFMPDRMKVSARLSAEATEGWVHPRDLKASIVVQNLFGTPAPKRRVESTLTLTPAYPAFASFPDYAFFDPQRAKDKHSEPLSATETDDQGQAEIDLQLHRYQSATYQLHLLAKAFEPGGGRSVAAEVTTMVSEQPYLVGYKSDGDLSYVNRGGVRKVSLLAINPAARKTAVADLKLQFVERKVLSVLIKQSNGLYKYESKPKEILLKEQTLAIPSAGTSLTLATSAPGNYAYVITNTHGLELNRIQYSVVGEGNVSRSLDRNAELQLALNKKDYTPGGEIEVSIRAPYTGSGLITIERDRVYTHQWFKTNKTASVQKIKLPKDFEGNGYVMVQFVRDAASDEIYMSPLSYGVAPFVTSLAKRTAPVVLRTPSLAKPGQTIKIKVESEKPAKAIVFAVDEGILQVARYQSPDPLKFFFEKRALEVTSYQILDLILPEFSKLMQAKAPGGDAGSALGKHLNPFKRKGEKPVVFWSGVIDIKNANELSYTVPESFNGALRVMAVVVTDDSIAAKANSVVVRGDLILLPTVPVALTPGDEVEIGIGLANNVKGSGKDAPITLQLKTSAGLETVGPAEQQIKVSEKSEATTKFRIRARAGEQAILGSASIVFSTQYKDKTARLENTLSVRPASPFVTLVQTGKFQGTGELSSKALFYPNFQHMEVAFSSSPWSFTAGLMQYLAAYPHGCTEQITSQIFPMVILSTRPELAEILATRRKLNPGEEAPEVKKSFARTVSILRSRQGAGGGFGLWSADDYAPFPSVYATHMLLEARERKLLVPEDMYQKSLVQLQTYVQQSSADRYNWRNQAYAAYILTRQGIVTTSALINLRNAMPQGTDNYARSDLGLAYLAASYQMLKQDKVAQQLLQPVWLDFVERIEKNLRHDYRDYYYDPLVHDAKVLYLIAKHFPAKLKQLPPQTFERFGAFVREGWYHSLSSSEVILAVDAYSTAVAQASSGKVEATAISRSGKNQPINFGPLNPLAKAILPLDTAKLRVSNKAALPLFYSMSESGYERNVPVNAEFQGMQIIREFLNSKGQPTTVATLGEELTVRIRVRSTERREIPQVALADLLPGALEPILTSPSDSTDANVPLWRQRLGGTSSWRIDYADIREDRVVFYGNVGYQDREVTYKVRATNVGEFVVPPAWGEAMYERTIFARSAGGKLTIKPLEK